MAIEKKRKTTVAAIQTGTKRKAESASRNDSDEETPSSKKKKKKKKKQGVPMGLLIGGGIGVLVVLIVAVSASAYFFMGPSKTDSKAPPKQVAQNSDKKDDKEPAPLPPPQKVQIIPNIKEGNPAAKQGGDNIVSNVRGAGYRTERRSELHQIGLAFQTFCDGYKGPNRTMDNFLIEIKNFGHIRDSVKDGYYTVNLRADPTSSMSIVAYETAVDKGRHMCVMGGGNVDYVPVDVVKKSTGK